MARPAESEPTVIEHEGEPRWRQRVTLAALALCAGALALAPAATPNIAPRTALVAALTLVLAAVAWLGGPRSHLLAALAAPLVAEHLLFSPGVPRAHDMVCHTWGLWSFFHTMQGGEPFPLWLHEISLGMPLTQFYSPLGYYANTPFYWAGLAAYEIFKGAFVLHAAIGAAGMYWLGRRATGSSRAGLVAAAAFAFAPYRLLVAHYRGAVAESLGLALLPWLLGVVFDPRPWHGRRLAAAALLAAAMVATHPLSVLTTAVAAAVWQLAAGWRRDTWKALRWRAAAAGLGLAIAGWYVLPLQTRLQAVSLHRAIGSWHGLPQLAGQGLRWSQPLERLGWRPGRTSEPRGTERDTAAGEMPVYFGWVLLACAGLAGLASTRRRRAGTSREWPGLELALAAVVAVALALASHPGAGLLARLPLFPVLQFPWRFFGPASVAAGLAAACVVGRASAARRGPIAAVLLALLVADGSPFTGAPDWVPAQHGFAHYFTTDQSCGERWGCWQVEPIPDRPPGVRVVGPVLPPLDFEPDVAHAKPGFGEYLNPEALATLLAAEHDQMGSLGTRWQGLADRPGVRLLDAAPYAGWAAPGASSSLELPATRRAGTIEIELNGRAGTVVVLEQHNPAWEASLDGRPATIEATAEGLLRLSVPDGARRARLHYRLRGWDVATGRALTLLALVFCAALALRRPLLRSQRGRG